MSNKKYLCICVILAATLIILTLPLVHFPKHTKEEATTAGAEVPAGTPTGTPAGVPAGAEEKIYLPIIMYHDIKKNNSGKDIINPGEFESDLKFLKNNNYTSITMQDVIDYVYEDKPLPENPIMITFDDGYLTTYRYAYPLLQEYDTKIVLSIIGKSTDDFTRVGDDHLQYAHLTWPLLDEMLESGLIEIQNHTYNLHATRAGRVGCKQKRGEALPDYEAVLTEDVMKLQQEIIDMTGITPTTFTIPYGEYNDNTIEIIKKLGFQAALTCDYGVNKITKDKETLYHLKRICRSHNYPMSELLEDVKKTIR
ncbi:polysaccharide deacetylase family protein [Anaerocolumna jejuensis]|uniref:polysaccharide deacetylase family protein n=1 Tax=Anaerocolumna jejuensis TaxID=259063 RepID=UPI003F7B61C5